jgi:hypothetical protein
MKHGAVYRTCLFCPPAWAPTARLIVGQDGAVALHVSNVEREKPDGGRLLHDETERRAPHGELGALEQMWRQAEEIAAIADALPAGPHPAPDIRAIVRG